MHNGCSPDPPPVTTPVLAWPTTPALVSPTTPVPYPLTSSRIDLEVDYWKKSSVQARYSSEEMSTQFRDAFGGSILSNDQVQEGTEDWRPSRLSRLVTCLGPQIGAGDWLKTAGD